MNKQETDKVLPVLPLLESWLWRMFGHLYGHLSCVKYQKMYDQQNGIVTFTDVHTVKYISWNIVALTISVLHIPQFIQFTAATSVLTILCGTYVTIKQQGLTGNPDVLVCAGKIQISNRKL